MRGRKPYTIHLLGRYAEWLAGWYLRCKGCTVIERNFRCLAGELDILCLDRTKTLLIVEVRYKSNPNNCVSAAASITQKKQRCILLATLYYLKHQPQLSNHPIRFDVICIQGSLRFKNILWLKGAFNNHSCFD
jgi:putative endonuclease